MDDRLILSYRQRREQRRQEYKELAARGCYSAIVIGVALVALRPLMVDQILSRAAAYSTRGRLDESKRQCEKALLIDDDNSEVWCQLARTCKAGGDRDAAYDAYLKAVQNDCTNGSANFELGMLYADDGRPRLAIPYFEQVRKLGSDKGSRGADGSASYYLAALHMLVQCYEKIGDPVKMEMALKEIRAFHPDYQSPEGRPVSLGRAGPAR